MKAVIVGAGVAGLSAAVKLRDAGWDVEIFETRNLLGGMCADVDMFGIRVQLYGPHVFHTADEEIWEFISRFTDFVPFTHKVVAKTAHTDDLLPIPYSNVTERMIGRRLSDEEIIEWFLSGYSTKMWGQDWATLPDYVRGRIGKLRRDNNDTRYFSDKYQALPKYGFGAMFDSMVLAAGGCVHFGVKPNAWTKVKADAVIYSGRLDTAFELCYGELVYRSLGFRFSIGDQLPAPVINCCDPGMKEIRISDLSLLTSSNILTGARFKPDQTVLVYEYPCDPETLDDGYYPMPWKSPQMEQYKRLAKVAAPKFQVIGRLGGYAHMNIDVAIRDGLNAAKVLTC